MMPKWNRTTYCCSYRVTGSMSVISLLPDKKLKVCMHVGKYHAETSDALNVTWKNDTRKVTSATEDLQTVFQQWHKTVVKQLHGGE